MKWEMANFKQLESFSEFFITAADEHPTRYTTKHKLQKSTSVTQHPLGKRETKNMASSTGVPPHSTELDNDPFSIYTQGLIT